MTCCRSFYASFLTDKRSRRWRNRPFTSSKICRFQNGAEWKTFLVKLSFICMRIESHFYIDDFVLSLALKQRIGTTRKWSIVSEFVYCNALTQFVPSSLLSTHHFLYMYHSRFGPQMNHFASLRTNTREKKNSAWLYQKWLKRKKASKMIWGKLCVLLCYCYSLVYFIFLFDIISLFTRTFLS